jgi:aryl-alcohol dehydrogenase-like predicted oxidoreductase
MKYVQFGTAGVRVSPLALGLGLRGQADEPEVERLILTAFENGINLFDCANVYGLMDDRAYAGRSEEILGRALRAHRDDVVITSKVAGAIGKGPNDQGTSRYHIMREAERSLRRLGTDRIDVYLLHQFDSTTPLEEQLRALDDLVRQGKVRYVGVCNYQAWQVCRALWLQDHMGASPLITVQNPYSLLNRALETEMFPLVRSQGLGIMAYAPLATGLLSGAYRPGTPPSEDSLWGSRRREVFNSTLSGRAAQVLATVTEIAKRHDRSEPQVALAWVISRPEVTVAISGADTFTQLEQNLGALDIELSPDDLQELDDVSSGMSMVLDGAHFGPPVRRQPQPV